VSEAVEDDRIEDNSDIDEEDDGEDLLADGFEAYVPAMLAHVHFRL
jgi:hypothetical protein